MLLTENKKPLVSRPVITEAKTDGPYKQYAGRMIVRQVCQREDVKNENHRSYPSRVWDINLAEDSAFMRRLKAGKVVGELEHPESGNTHLARVSHKILNVERMYLPEGNEFGVPAGKYLVDTYVILKTPMGQIAEELHHCGISPGQSSRGRGDVRSEGDVEIVQDNYVLDTFDLVYQPSVVEADRSHRVKTEGAPVVPSVLPEPSAPGVTPSPPSGEAPPPSPLPTDADMPQDMPETQAPPTMSREEVEALVRRLREMVISKTASDDMVITHETAMSYIEKTSDDAGPETIKFRSELAMLCSMLVSAFAEVFGPNKIKPSKHKKGDGEAKEEEEETEASESSEDEKKTEAKMVEADMSAVANQVKEANKDNVAKAYYAGDLRDLLRKTGHDETPENIAALESEMSKIGLNVQRKESPGFKKEDKSMTQATAVDIVNKLTEENAQIRKELAAFKQGKVGDSKLKVRYEALVKIADELLNRSESLTKENANLKVRYNAAVRLVEGVASRFKKLSVVTHVESKYADLPAVAKAVLTECKSTTEVDKKAKVFKSVSETKHQVDPTAPPITESSAKRAVTDGKATPKKGLGSLMERVAERTGEVK